MSVQLAVYTYYYQLLVILTELAISRVWSMILFYVYTLTVLQRNSIDFKLLVLLFKTKFFALENL